MKQGKIKWHRRRAHLKEMFFDLAVDVWWLYIGMAPITVPLTMLLIGGALYKLLGW